MDVYDEVDRRENETSQLITCWLSHHGSCCSLAFCIL